MVAIRRLSNERPSLGILVYKEDAPTKKWSTKKVAQLVVYRLALSMDVQASIKNKQHLHAKTCLKGTETKKFSLS